jgi:hypothetical protein
VALVALSHSVAEGERIVPARNREVDRASSAELDKLAEVSPEDIERAKQSWRQHASPEFADLLDAEPDDDGAPA